MRTERGTIVVMAAVCLLGLTLFSAIVLDMGVLWTARRQAQNAADAGALSAAINLMWNPLNVPEAVEAAKRLAHPNAVWGQELLSPDILVQTGLTCPPGTGGGPGCVRVQVNRGGLDRLGILHTNVMPTFFANLAGINSQAISATAMAQVSSGNAVSCLKPWVLPDRWVDNDQSSGGWANTDVFTKPPDAYTAPGFKYPDDQGTELILKGNANDWSAGWVQKITFGGNNSASDYNEEIYGCPPWVPTVSLYDGSVPCAGTDDENPPKGCVKVSTGVTEGPTVMGVQDLVDLDLGATWNVGTNSVDSPCMTNGTCEDIYGVAVNISPRIVPVGLFNPEAFWDETSGNGCHGQNCVVQITNLFGFFIEGMCDQVYPNAATRPAMCGPNNEAQKTVIGRMMQYPGQLTGGATTSTFAQAVRLVR